MLVNSRRKYSENLLDSNGSVMMNKKANGLSKNDRFELEYSPC